MVASRGIILATPTLLCVFHIIVYWLGCRGERYTHTHLYHGHWLASQVWWQLGQDVTGHTYAYILILFYFFFSFCNFHLHLKSVAWKKNSYSEKNNISRRFDGFKVERFLEKKGRKNTSGFIISYCHLCDNSYTFMMIMCY